MNRTLLVLSLLFGMFAGPQPAAATSFSACSQPFALQVDCGIPVPPGATVTHVSIDHEGYASFPDTGLRWTATVSGEVLYGSEIIASCEETSSSEMPGLPAVRCTSESAVTITNPGSLRCRARTFGAGWARCTVAYE